MLSWLDISGYTILVLVWVILFVKALVDLIGKPTLQQLGWQLYLIIGPKLGLNKGFNEYGQKRKELWETTREKRSISAQDQYAKWTKLNRKCDKLNAELKLLEEQISKDKAKVNTVVNQILFLLISGPVWFFRIWYRKNVLFYLPKGALPKQIEWVMALPFFATGTVGLTMWMQCVGQVLSQILFMFEFLFIDKPVAKPQPPKVSQKLEKSPQIEEIEPAPVS